MKFLQTILALIALFALRVPCVHAEEYHHHQCADEEVCPADHCACHTCSNEPCVDTLVVVPLVPVSEIPIRQIQLITIFENPRPIFVTAFRPPEGLLFLQTVQLLI